MDADRGRVNRCVNRFPAATRFRWQKQALEHLTAALQDGRTQRGESQSVSADRARIAVLEATIAKKDRVIAEVSEEYLDMKKVWGPMTAHWVPPDRRNEVVDCVTSLSTRTAVQTPHGPVPRDHWRTRAERDGILRVHERHPLDGYRRLTYLLLDAGDVAVSPTSGYRVLKNAGRLDRWTRTPSKKGTGFDQPTQAHQHWHIDFTYLNIAGTCSHRCAILDGWSRYLVHWELRESMTTQDVTTILQRAREKFPDACPRMISDNGPQFIAACTVRSATSRPLTCSPDGPTPFGRPASRASKRRGAPGVSRIIRSPRNITYCPSRYSIVHPPTCHIHAEPGQPICRSIAPPPATATAPAWARASSCAAPD